ncbi:ankyrin repeat domain-containing protein [Pectobacterium parmentieri]|nr:ankyrin repeat domain-containing protein [Pectobacterium parmentieri]ACX88197.1 Ankyrin [Pectobacterium parmentieri WPP163]POW26960.1 ankyrin [Pectobacterium parmentieri]
MLRLLKNIRLKKISSVFLLLPFLVFGCHAMKKYPAENFFSGTQLSLAQAIEKNDESEVKKLSAHTDLNRPGAQDMTLLFFAMQNSYDKQAKHLSIVSYLVSAGASPLQKVPSMRSVAEATAKSDDPIFIAALIDGGMSPNVEIEGTPIIFSSASEHSQKVMAYLVSKGADVNRKDSLGQTVLIESLSGFQLDSVIWLLNHGADPRVITDNGWGFNNMLSKIIERQSNAKNSAKLEQIKNLAINKGMTWPPSDY